MTPMSASPTPCTRLSTSRRYGRADPACAPPSVPQSCFPYVSADENHRAVIPAGARTRATARTGRAEEAPSGELVRRSVVGHLLSRARRLSGERPSVQGRIEQAWLSSARDRGRCAEQGGGRQDHRCCPVSHSHSVAPADADDKMQPGDCSPPGLLVSVQLMAVMNAPSALFALAARSRPPAFQYVSPTDVQGRGCWSRRDWKTWVRWSWSRAWRNW